MLLAEELLQEVIHISEETRKTSESIYSKIDGLYRHVVYTPVNDLNKFIKKGNTTFTEILFNNEIKVTFSVTFYNFIIKDEYEELGEYYAEGGSVCIDNKGRNFLCNLNIILKCGTLLPEKNIDTITHEIQHIYEQYRIGEEYKERFDVATIKTLMFSGNEIEKKIGEALYISSNSEKDSFLNGAYAEIMANPNPNVRNCIENTTLYKKLSRLYELLTFFKENNFETEIRKTCNISYNKFIKYIEKQYQNLKYKTSRVMCKAQDDKNKQGWH